MQILEILERPFLIILAGLCFYVSLADKDERQRIVNRVDPVWKGFLKKTGVPLSRLTVYLRAVARLMTYLLDWVFGKKLLSLRAVCISACLALASLEFATTALFPDLIRAVSLSSVTLQRPLTKDFWVVLFVLLAFFPLTIRDTKRMRLWYVTVFLTVATWGAVYLTMRWDGPPSKVYDLNAFVNFSVVLLVSFVCDLVFIVLLRRGFRYAENLVSKVGIIAVALGSLLLSVLLVALPFFPWWMLNGTGPIALAEAFNQLTGYQITPFGRVFNFLFALSLRPQSAAHLYVLELLPSLGASNIFDLFAASLYFVLAVLMMVHPLLWGVARRVIEILDDKIPQVVGKKWMWFSLGVFFLVWGWKGKGSLGQLAKFVWRHLMGL